MAIEPNRPTKVELFSFLVTTPAMGMVVPESEAPKCVATAAPLTVPKRDAVAAAPTAAKCLRNASKMRLYSSSLL